MTSMCDAPPMGWILSDGGLYDNNPIDALKIIRPEATAFVPMLKDALNSPDRWVRDAALEALFAVATWSDPSRQEPAAALLAVLAYDPVDLSAQEQEGFTKFRDRKRAAETLAKLDPAAQQRAIAQLSGDLRDLGSPRSYEAALLLPALRGGTSTVVSTLLEFIREGDDTSRRIAMILLEPIAGPAQASAVLRAITQPGAEGKINLLGRLSWWESVGAVEGGPGFRRLIKGTMRTETSLIEPGVMVLKAIGAQVERRAIGELIATVQQPGVDAVIFLARSSPWASSAPTPPRRSRPWKGRSGRTTRPIAGCRGALPWRTRQERWRRGPSARSPRTGTPPRSPSWPAWSRTRGRASRRTPSWLLFRLGLTARPAVPALVKGLKDPRQVVRAHSAMALGQVRCPEVLAVLPDLMAALDDDNQVVRLFSAGAVAQYGVEAKAALPRLVDVLWESGDDEIARSLGRIGPDAAVAIPSLLCWEVANPIGSDEQREAMEKIMPRTPGATVAGSIAAIKAGDPAGRPRAAYELGRLIEKPPHPDEAVAALGDALGDPDPLVRRVAAAILGRLAPTVPDARPPLNRAARDPDGWVRRLAAWGLSRAERRSEPAAIDRRHEHTENQGRPVRHDRTRRLYPQLASARSDTRRANCDKR